MKTDAELILPGLQATLTRRRVDLDQAQFSVQEQLREGNQLRTRAREADRIYEEKRRLVMDIQHDIASLEKLIKEYS